MQALKAPTPGKINLSELIIFSGSFVKKTDQLKSDSFMASSKALDAEWRFPQS